jgi:predicted lipoprotein with Yx(FWY)xxD motif
MGTDSTGKAVFTYEVSGIAKTLYIFNKDSDSGQQNFTHCPYDNGGTDNIGCDTGIQNAGTNGGANADPNGGFWPPVLMTAQSTMDAMNDTWASFNRVPQILSSDSDPDANMQQISCNGHPIYTYTSDTVALQAKGDGIQSYDNKWVVLTNPCEAPLAMP